MKIPAILAVLVALSVAYVLGAQGRNDPKVSTSPHAEAIQLVIKTQQARLREVDQEKWDHDVKERPGSCGVRFIPASSIRRKCST